MEIKIIRFGRYHHAVSGRLLIDGQHVCDTLEQDTGSLPEGEYVMCRNKASSLPYYIYSGKEDIGRFFCRWGMAFMVGAAVASSWASAFIWASSSAVRSITISFCPVSACSWYAIAPSW